MGQELFWSLFCPVLYPSKGAREGRQRGRRGETAVSEGLAGRSALGALSISMPSTGQAERLLPPTAPQARHSAQHREPAAAVGCLLTAARQPLLPPSLGCSSDSRGPYVLGRKATAHPTLARSLAHQLLLPPARLPSPAPSHPPEVGVELRCAAREVQRGHRGAPRQQPHAALRHLAAHRLCAPAAAQSGGGSRRLGAVSSELSFSLLLQG